MQILIYIIILLTGAFLVRKNLIPLGIKKKLGLLQTISLFLILGVMGYKIGINDSILKNLPSIGMKALIFGLLTSIFSIFTTFLIFKFTKSFSKDKGEEKC